MMKKYFNYSFVILSVIFIVGIVVVFFLSQLEYAVGIQMSVDEHFGLKRSCRLTGYLSMLIKGVPHQGSPSPLFYFAYKFLDQIRESVGWFGLRPSVYFRLFSNAITSLSAFVLGCLFVGDIFRKQKSFVVIGIQMVLLSAALGVFLFSPQVYYWASAARPYAAWNSLWMFVLGVSLLDRIKFNWSLFFGLIIFAMITTATLFQVGMMMVACVGIGLLRKHSVKMIFWEGVKIFGIACVIIIYYCLDVQATNLSRGPALEWAKFLALWRENAVIIPWMCGALALCFFQRDNRKYAVAPLSVLLLYLIGPILFMITLSKGYFYDERQYIYYDLVQAVFLFTAMACLPACMDGFKQKKKQTVIAFLIIFVGISLGITKVYKRFTTAIQTASKVLKDTSRIELHYIDTLYWKHNDFYWE